MLFKSYEEQSLFINSNFMEKANADGTYAYRGELVLIEGEVADAKGRKKPPHAVLRNAILLSVDDKIQFVCGCLDQLALLEKLVEKYQGDFAADAKSLLFVVNITKPMQVELGGITFVLIPLIEGIAWNELLDVLHLEKSDLKGTSAAQKVVIAYNEFCNYKAKSPVMTLEEGAALTADLKREGYGAI